MENKYRLSSNIIPINYDLITKVDFNTYTFSGSVNVDVHVKCRTNEIILNSLDLKFGNVYYQDSLKKRVDVNKVEFNVELNTVKLSFVNSIEPGNGQLHIDYSGELNDNMLGFYRVKYRYLVKEHDEPYTAVTQFEPCEARRAFPCWDEPAFKATFDVTIIAESKYTVLSNMPLKAESILDDGALKKCIFERTPIMSTYLVAYVIGNYACLKEEFYKNISIRVFTPINKEHLGEFAMEFGKSSLQFYTEYFGIDYPLPKMDLIAVPENPMEAMENFGLIIFNETNMLLDKSNSSGEIRLTNAYIVAHEIAHQWFGNLVTMEWWNDLWLNEGFATWAGYLCIEPYMKNYGIWTSFVSARNFEAFDLDSLNSTHPIEANIVSPTEIDEIFDEVTYCKGACVLRMLNSFMGAEVFRNGVHDYLNALKWSNAKTEDLWKYLTKQSSTPIDEFMENWTKKPGYPLVSVSKRVNSNGESILDLKQSRFFASGATEENKTIWKIPILVTTKSTYPNTVKQFLIENETAELNLGPLSSDDWVFINHDAFILHRTLYSNEMIQQLSENLFSLNSIDRLTILNDAFALAQAGLMDIGSLFRLIGLYKIETDPYVWNNLIDNLLNIYSLILYTDQIEQFRRFTVELCTPIAHKIGWETCKEEDIQKSMCQERVHFIMALMLDDFTHKQSEKLFLSKRNGTADIPASLKRAVYTSILLNSNYDNKLEEFFDFYEKGETPEERWFIFKSLSNVKNEDEFRHVLDFSLNRASFEDAPLLFAEMSKNVGTAGRGNLVWNFIKENWDEIFKRYCSGLSLGRLLKPVIEHLNSKEDVNDVKMFFASKNTSEGQQQVLQGLEKLSIRVEWLNRIKVELKSFSF